MVLGGEQVILAIMHYKSKFAMLFYISNVIMQKKDIAYNPRILSVRPFCYTLASHCIATLLPEKAAVALNISHSCSMHRHGAA